MDIALAACREGDQLLQAGKADDALAAYERAIEMGAPGSQAHHGQARAYFARKCVEEAVDSLEIALAINPDDAEALILFARIRRETGIPRPRSR